MKTRTRFSASESANSPGYTQATASITTPPFKWSDTVPCECAEPGGDTGIGKWIPGLVAAQRAAQQKTLSFVTTDW